MLSVNFSYVKSHSFNNFRGIFPPATLLFIKSLNINLMSSTVRNLNENFSLWCWFYLMDIIIGWNLYFRIFRYILPKTGKRTVESQDVSSRLKKVNRFHYRAKEPAKHIKSIFKKVSSFSLSIMLEFPLLCLLEK